MKSADQSGDNLIDQNTAGAKLNYDNILAYATVVFGTRLLAEEWLARPCRHLNNNIPAEIIDDVCGLQTVKEYLERIEFGVYQ
ncbi:hypothetical protein A986_02336 [Pseudomonas fluorescens BRIP34879]|nr:hypothetical protein A986_02336 [Pseudomonas fluorescens BRIP34879]